MRNKEIWRIQEVTVIYEDDKQHFFNVFPIASSVLSGFCDIEKALFQNWSGCYISALTCWYIQALTNIKPKTQITRKFISDKRLLLYEKTALQSDWIFSIVIIITRFYIWGRKKWLTAVGPGSVLVIITPWDFPCIMEYYSRICISMDNRFQIYNTNTQYYRKFYYNMRN